MINELFRKMTVAQIFSALSGTVCMLVDSIIIGRLLGVDSMSAYPWHSRHCKGRAMCHSFPG